MNRRTYLGLAATGVAGSIAGCSSASDGSEYPPYPDSETIDLSGDGVGLSDEFELTLDGPTLVDIEHMGSDNFTVMLTPTDAVETEPDGTNQTTMDGNPEPTDRSTNQTATNSSLSNQTATNSSLSNQTATNNSLGNQTATNNSLGNQTATDVSMDQPSTDDGADSETTDTLPGANVVAAVGPYDGRTLVPIDTGSYVLNVREADAEWTATVYDLPAYDDGTGVSLPIEREGTQYDVVGPINFGEQSDTEFAFSVTGTGLNRVFLTDRTGDESLTVTSMRGSGEQSVSQTVGGVGYIEVRAFGSWTVELS